jgi:hypothetical protein
MHDEVTLRIEPAWMITGQELPGGVVRLIASRDVVDGVVEVTTRYEHAHDGSPLGPGPIMSSGQKVEARIGLKRFVVVEAASYPEAFRALFEQWNPAGDDRPAPLALPGF